jgi:DNA-binding response OmpR family regulator
VNSNSRPLVLIVDDNSDNLRVLTGILETSGYNAAIAMSGAEALVFLTKEQPELILLDVMMPGMDGYELCGRLKESSATREIPVIFLTACTDSDDVVHGFTAGAVDYVAKPFNAMELLARVKTHVEFRRARLEIKTLRGFVPICASCKSVRQPDNTWLSLEQYLAQNSELTLSHGVCPTCMWKFYPGTAEKLYGREKRPSGSP